MPDVSIKTNINRMNPLGPSDSRKLETGDKA
jgi:hypothetical protein